MIFIVFEYIATSIVARINIQINRTINIVLLTKLCKNIIITNEANEPIVPGAHFEYPIKKRVENI